MDGQAVTERPRHLRSRAARCRPPTRRSGFAVRPASRRSDRDEPFANFFFGGFGNNYVDHGDEKRYREYYSFPGADLNEIGGRNFVQIDGRVESAAAAVRAAGTPGFYATWLRPAIFAGGLVTNVDASDLQRRVADLGAQVDVRFSLLSALDLTLSVGAAEAFEGGRSHGEAMISLKILR